MTILVLGLHSCGFASDGLASDQLRSRTDLCSLSRISRLYQAAGVTLRELPL